VNPFRFIAMARLRVQFRGSCQWEPSKGAVSAANAHDLRHIRGRIREIGPHGAVMTCMIDDGGCHQAEIGEALHQPPGAIGGPVPWRFGGVRPTQGLCGHETRMGG